MGGVVSCGGSSESAVAAEARSSLGSPVKHADSVVMRLTETQLEEFRECFNAFDKDGGGSIDSTELGARTRARRTRAGEPGCILKFACVAHTQRLS